MRHYGDIESTKNAQVIALILAVLSLFFLKNCKFFIMGALLWIPIEYLIHRFVFHVNTKSQTLKKAIRIFHINHHIDPTDKSIVCVPSPIFVISSIFMASVPVFFGLRIEDALGVSLGFNLALITYDIIHYNLHFKEENSLNWIERRLKPNHMAHHFKNIKKRFGVTSSFMDWLFRS